MNNKKQIVLNLDSRKRISLGVFAKHEYYLVECNENGVIILTPAVIKPIK